MELQFEKYRDGLVPAIVQDAETRQVLMLGFMNEAALLTTQETARVTFYSRTRRKLWTKGETSGNFLHVREILVDCDNDTLLITATPEGPVCHTGSSTCFGGNPRREVGENVLFELEHVIDQRRSEPSQNSYVSRLFAEGLNRIAQKVGEEAVEVVIAVKDENIDDFKSEAADLLFHFLILLRSKEVKLREVLDVLLERRK